MRSADIDQQHNRQLPFLFKNLHIRVAVTGCYVPVDIPDIIARFKNLEAENDRKRTDQSFFIEKQEIVDNAYDLSINKYKEIEYIPVEYPPTSAIMANLRALEKEVQESMAELEKMLGDEMA